MARFHATSGLDDFIATHSVARHLDLATDDYDRRIRQLVPAYENLQRVLLDVLSAAFGSVGPGRVLDLGGGTGATTAAVAARFPQAEVEMWDTDPQMLAIAGARCAGFGARVRAVERSFCEPLPGCDAVVACIALHHVKDLKVKGGIYRNIFEALRPGGVFVNADTAVPSAGWAREFALGKWIADLGELGTTEEQARGYLAQWAGEDYYPPVPAELGLLQAAGFAEPECYWREGAAIVFGAAR